MYQCWHCRLWIFPPCSLSSAEKGLREISGVDVEVFILSFSNTKSWVSLNSILFRLSVVTWNFYRLFTWVYAKFVKLGFHHHVFALFSFLQLENLDPLVHRAIAAASAIPDLQSKCGLFLLSSSLIMDVLCYIFFSLSPPWLSNFVVDSLISLIVSFGYIWRIIKASMCLAV